MQRVIKFRGKRINNGKWIIGDFYFFEGANIRHYHQTSHPDEGLQNSFTDYEVITESVGQFTGLKDKHGKDIYEGDIYLATRSYMPSRGYKKKGFPQTITVICVVEWSVYEAGWSCKEISPIKEHIEFEKNAPYHYYQTSLTGASNGKADWIEVIGNIYENPEVIQGN